MILIGEVNRLKVMRKTDIAYQLENDIFLHINELTREINIDEEIDVFLYYDKLKRLSATMKEPKITTTIHDFVEVVEVKPELGVFVNINISKDILLSKDVLPQDLSLWPQKGDLLYLRLVEKKNTLEAKFVYKDELEQKDTLKVNDKVEAIVQRVGPNGTNLYTLDKINIFVYYKNQRTTPRLGEKLEVEIINVNENKEYSGRLIKNKEFMITDDKEVILDYLIKNKGGMPYTNNTDPEVIYNVFKMSKKAFKRALGNLYKERKIILEENMTYLNKEVSK